MNDTISPTIPTSGPPSVRRVVPALLAFVFLCCSDGCQQKSKEVPAAPPPVIPVSLPVEREVTDYVDFTGQTYPVNPVSVRARATGYLLKMEKPFKEGSDVKEGDLLFEVDPKPYQAIVDQAHSQVILAQAQLKLAKITYDRDRALGSTLSTSQQQLDQDKAAQDAADARVKAALATLDAAQQNLDFTRVVAPISGRISRYYYTYGNLVAADQTILTTIVSMDPIYAFFEVDQRTHDRYVKALNNQKMAAAKNKTANPKDGEKSDKPSEPDHPVLMALEGDEGFPLTGNVDFINNQINPSTGTVAMRGVFKNERPEGGNWRILPGSFVRIRLPIGKARPELLVIERAIGSDQSLKFVYVVDDENKIQSRRVVTGALQQDGLRVIEPYDAAKETGLKPTDHVVVGGLPQLRPHTLVKPELIPMPTQNTIDSAAPVRGRPQPPPPGSAPKK